MDQNPFVILVKGHGLAFEGWKGWKGYVIFKLVSNNKTLFLHSPLLLCTLLLCGDKFYHYDTVGQACKQVGSGSGRPWLGPRKPSCSAPTNPDIDK